MGETTIVSEMDFRGDLKKYRSTLILLVLAVLCGIYLRLDQIDTQLLIDDEWHAVHKLLSASQLKDIVLSFGYADHSVPLTLFYWLESLWFGLDELGMRWPMIIAGVVTLVVFPLYVLRQLGPREAVLFAWLVALSPLLINYTRTARPYAITLLLTYVAYWAFHEYLRRPNVPRYAVISAVCMVAAVWLHPIVLFFLMAPFLVEGVNALLGNPEERWRRIGRLLKLGLPVATSILALLLPTLLADPAALANKLGTHGIEADSWLGAWYLWAGATSPAFALLFLVLALIGWPSVWRIGQPVHAAVTGLLMTLAVIVLTRPDWIQLPIVLARYLLPFVPLLLLLAVAGSVKLVDGLQRRLPRVCKPFFVAMLCLPVLAHAVQSPLRLTIRYPNNESLHSFFQFDFRTDKNLFAQWLLEIPVSPFWNKLSSHPKGSLHIAVAPWQFESYHWAGPRWEAMSRQHVVPGLLSGLCVDSRLGEYPMKSRIKLKNMVHLADNAALAAKEISLIVFNKPFEHSIAGIRSVVGKDLMQCQGELTQRFGEPVYEDAVMQLYAVPGSSLAGLQGLPDFEMRQGKQ